MVTRVYVLIETTVGKTREVATTLRQVEGIVSTDVVTGPFDIISLIEAADIGAVGQVVETGIHSIDGVTRTVTCVAISS